MIEQWRLAAGDELGDVLALLGDMADKLRLIQRGLEYGDHQTTEIDLLLARGRAVVRSLTKGDTT